MKKIVCATLTVITMSLFGLDWKKVAEEVSASGDGSILVNAYYSINNLQQQKILKELEWTPLRFTNGVVSSVAVIRGKLNIYISFGSGFEVTAHVENPDISEWAMHLQKGAKIKLLKGVVPKWQEWQEYMSRVMLEDVVLVPEKMPNCKFEFDPETVTGKDIINGSGLIKGGYNSAQATEISKQLEGKVLTFENGEITMIYKINGDLRVEVRFRDANREILYAIAVITDYKKADSLINTLNHGMKIKSVTGRMVNHEALQVEFVLDNADIEAAK